MAARGMEFAWPGKASQVIWPVFLPFLGCPRRCVFCAQEAQTGVKTPKGAEQLNKLLAACRSGLAARRQKGLEPPQLAFYGGTFTALPEPLWRQCLAFAAGARADGLINGFRCSTRPDSIQDKRLEELLAAGCHLVELGVQSFSDAALAASGRGISSSRILAACQKLASAGLGPGIQLMPGMPGANADDFMADVRTAIDLHAACLRFYPCLVLEGSALAAMWRQGAYAPWTVADVLAWLPRAWLMAARADIAVIRMGVAPQAGFEQAILAGPWHEALGSRIMAKALLLAVEQNAAGIPFRLYAPRRCQGFFWGWRGENAPAWRNLHLQSVEFWDRPVVRLEWDQGHVFKAAAQPL